MTPRRRILVRLLPDGSGRVRVHYFCRHPLGPIRTPSAELRSTLGPLRAGGVVGYLACHRSRKDLLPFPSRDGRMELVPHSDDPRAATCPECLATPEYAAAVKELEEAAKVPGEQGGA